MQAITFDARELRYLHELISGVARNGAIMSRLTPAQGAAVISLRARIRQAIFAEASAPRSEEERSRAEAAPTEGLG